MDIQAYIQSGVIESYVLGIADTQDLQELQRLRLLHPEIETAIRDCEDWLLQNARQDAVPAAAGAKAQLFDRLAKEQDTAVIVPLHTKNKAGINTRYLVAASLILFIVSAGINIYLYNKYSEAVHNYNALSIQNKSLLVDNDLFQAKFSALQQEISLLSSPDVVKVPMPGIAGKEQHLVTLFWNTNTKDVYLVANNLPKAPEGKQYQLWALVDGKPVNAGMLSDCESLCRFRPVQKAQAFAITLEKTGGSTVPTLEQMYVLGNVKS